MASDVFVNQLQRVGDTVAGLAAPQSAVVFDASQFSVTDDPDTITTGQGSITGRTVVSLAPGGVASVGYVSAARTSATTTATLPVWYNDTGTARTIAHLVLVPMDNVSASGSNYWTVTLALGSAITTPLASLSTSAASWSAGVAVAFSGSVTVPAGDVLVVRQLATGSPTSLGIFVQGR